MEITKIVITGGPCAGKSTVISRVQSTLSQMGYTVLYVPETASELILGGVAPWTCGTKNDFQKFLLMLQLEKEKIFEAAAKTMPGDKFVMLCDRGTLDNKAYMAPADFTRMIKDAGLSETALRDNYDAVFHLVTAAKGAEEFYTTANNQARTETVAEATELDDRLIAAWTGHPHFRIIDSSPCFEDKVQKLVSAISAFLGETESFEIERKFLIEYPDTAMLESLENCNKTEIVQTYLRSDGGDEIRIRRRGIDGYYTYFKTVKRGVTDIRRIETEWRISLDEYTELLKDADPERRQISKTRYCLTHKNQCFEIDVYPFWKDTAIVEIELDGEDTPVEFPKEISVIREVTDDEAYKNASLAKPDSQAVC